MRKTTQILTLLLLTVLIVSVLCVPAFALDESEVEAAVSASSKENVTGNVLIWFLCAVAFLKVSQKIDSFMATLGVNVGRTGGSMLAEAMIAMRAVTMVVGGGHGGAGRASSAAGGTAGKSGASGMTGFFKGGLVGMAGRHITNSAVKTATTQTSAVNAAQNQVRQTAAAAATQTSPDAHINNEVHTGGSAIHTENSTHVGSPPQDDAIIMGGGLPHRQFLWKAHRQPLQIPISTAKYTQAVQLSIPKTAYSPECHPRRVLSLQAAVLLLKQFLWKIRRLPVLYPAERRPRKGSSSRAASHRPLSLRPINAPDSWCAA